METMQKVPVFSTGDVIRHKMYNYRGVIVGHDNECRADDSWYYGNETQPRRDQPWYHILVHGQGYTTYVAEENVMKDRTGEQVVHPLLKKFFLNFRDGRYSTEP